MPKKRAKGARSCISQGLVLRSGAWLGVAVWVLLEAVVGGNICGRAKRYQCWGLGRALQQGGELRLLRGLDVGYGVAEDGGVSVALWGWGAGATGLHCPCFVACPFVDLCYAMP